MVGGGETIVTDDDRAEKKKAGVKSVLNAAAQQIDDPLRSERGFLHSFQVQTLCKYSIAQSFPSRAL